ncbi:precorrin-6y C5,15-methyltransferase (decarboxylating) subunit CbiE [Paludifilum halophilum]|uniref:precorrin-6y C5,15-methyltransferase (decarboxylating) subunit CbiE n=1 Tax=Paludifilum halophilum TaxID=1642702 RepID=UPI00146B8BCE|nr:precorrin-6y C5,15-methyltransferase (decarboxylating) subunit CbiE [Paludifilum halophilum]
MHRIFVIGVGAEGPAGLSAEALRRIADCDFLYGGRRLLRLFPENGERRVPVGTNLKEVAESLLSNRDRRQVVLATGDPNFFGIADYLYRHVGREYLTVIPHLSSVQLAFARIKESWHDAFLASVHGRSADRVADWVRRNPKVALLTDSVHHPGAIARRLISEGIRDCRMAVAEHLGTEAERVTFWRLPEAADQNFADLNVVILLREGSSSVPEMTAGGEEARWGLGIEDEAFFQRKPEQGLLTKKEVRVVSLAQLNLHRGSVLWDIGAGSGSVALEAAGLIGSSGIVYAVEKNCEDVENIRKNAATFGREIRVIHAEAPEGLEDLEEPDAVFIGGSGGRLAPVLALCGRRLKAGGRLVMNAATVENQSEGWRRLKEAGFRVEAIQLNVSRSQAIEGLTRFKALNPVTILTAVKERKGE